MSEPTRNSSDDLARGRERDQLEASEYRNRKMVEEVVAEKRAQSWLELGFNLSKDHDFNRLKATLEFPDALGVDVMKEAQVQAAKEALAWAGRAQQRAATLGKRLLGWIMATVGLVGGILGILKYLQDWRGH